MKQRYVYNVHDIVYIESDQRLPELGYFLSDRLSKNADITVRITPDPHRHRRSDSITYRDLPGHLGFSLVINRNEADTEVFVSPLIGASPHVLYTNVVEPLVRWTLVRKGFALMHGACLAFGDKALFITARTDTGKTTTILHTLRHNPGRCRFLSDDMTIFSRGGVALSYPKPLTISQHTLQAVGGAPLSVRERAFLQLQSRLHSRGGRRAGMWLSDSSFPAATLNAIVQWLIPPPKYMVDRLVPGTELTRQAQLACLVLIERGPDLEDTLLEEEKVKVLISNAEDAYGFPPYPVLAEALSHWEGSDLHESEQAIVTSAVARLPAVRLRSPRYDWYQKLPGLLDPTLPDHDPTLSDAQAARSVGTPL